MNRKVRRVFQWALVVALTTVLSTSPVSAGWALHRMHCQIRSSCCVPVCPPCPVYCPPVCPPPVVVSCCPCGCGAVLGSQPVVGEPGTVVESLPEGTPLAQPDESKAIESTAPVDSPSDITSEAPAAESPVADAPAADPPAADPPAADPPAEPDAGNLFGDPPAADAPAADVPSADPFGAPPAADEPAADLFGTPPADATPEAAPVDNLFGDPPADAPAEDPPMDDLFGDPPAEEAAPAGDQPAVDDLFGAEAPAADAPAADDIFGGAVDAPAADAPAADTPAVDDIFGTEPAEVPAADAPVDDIFGAAPAATDGDDLFGAPAADPATAEDDLFGVPVSDPVEASPEAAPTDDSIDNLFGSPEENAAPASSIDDLFGVVPAASAAVVEESFEELPAPVVGSSVHVVSSEVPQVKSLADTKVRTWIDNSGQFHTDGRLVEINEDNVRLFKTNGRTCTVPSDRLSEADAAYVDSVQQQIETARIAMLSSN